MQHRKCSPYPLARSWAHCETWNCPHDVHPECSCPQPSTLQTRSSLIFHLSHSRLQSPQLPTALVPHDPLISSATKELNAYHPNSLYHLRSIPSSHSHRYLHYFQHLDLNLHVTKPTKLQHHCTGLPSCTLLLGKEWRQNGHGLLYIMPRRWFVQERDLNFNILGLQLISLSPVAG